MCTSFVHKKKKKKMVRYEQPIRECVREITDYPSAKTLLLSTRSLFMAFTRKLSPCATTYAKHAI